MTARRFVLLDRDGTINVEQNYLSHPDQMELYPGVGAALRRLRDLGFGLVVVTNQSGVARGYFDMATLDSIHDRMTELLRAEDIVLDGIYICPHAPDEDCDCRKPLPGMVEQAMADFGFDPTQAFLVGDKAVDVNMGHAVGAVSILVRTGWGKKAEEEGGSTPDAIVDDLPAAAEWIAQRLSSQTARDAAP